MELEDLAMLWFFGGYVLAAIAFYSYITVSAKEMPEYGEMPSGMTTPACYYGYATPRSSEGGNRKAA